MSHVISVTEPEGVPGCTLHRCVGPDRSPVPGPRVAIIGLMHGNELVGDGVVAELEARVAEELCAGELLLVRANLRAFEQGLRHTADGVDLNRLWDPATLTRLSAESPEELCYEERRAIELAPLLTTADAVLDLHSTSRPSAPFLLFRDDQKHAMLARRLGVAHLVTGMHENTIMAGGLGSNVGLAPGARSERIGFTFEAGQHTDPDNVATALQVTLRMLHGLGVWRTEPPESQVQARVFEVTERFVQAPAGITPWRFVNFIGGEAGAGRRGPLRQLHSFEEVQADEVILKRGDDVVRAAFPFTMLMPAPDTAPGTDLYYVSQERHGGLTGGESRTHDEARREAQAIERMLDLLADDDFVTGTTWAAFDSRRLFDLCASVVGRNIRLPVGHPHRRITIVGRGDAPTGEGAERRVSHRYRQAMRVAMARGLPVERIQLLRGASLAWLDALTSHAMLEVLQRRQSRVGDDPSGVDLRISLRQPHTVSLLVAGDLDLALATGDTRYVRVALLVEAASVEPNGPTARLRILRTGMLSSRREVLVSARRLVTSLRDEHRYVVEHGALRDEPAVHELLTDDMAIRSVPDPEKLVALRSALYRVQLGLWCDRLRHEVREPQRLKRPDDVGRWLAQTMTATGILDASSLEALAVRRDGDGWWVDPDHLARVQERVRGGQASDAPPAVLFGPPAVPSLPQPFLAEHVDADSLERWVGWKRFVRGVRSVPDTRGKDFDLAFSGETIRGTLTSWYRYARSKARSGECEVLVVLAGDGLNPERDRIDSELLSAHQALMVEPALHYVRIQHAQGTHLSWMKDFVLALQRRPRPSRPVALQWEGEHGATVSVVVVAERPLGAPDGAPWSLEGWSICRCGVILSDLESTGEDYEVGIFTEDSDAYDVQANQELLAFGRAHCDGLMAQAEWRVRGESGPPEADDLEQCLVAQIARWIDRVRVWRESSGTTPATEEERAAWVARRLGLKDQRLARALAREMMTDTPSEEAARALWQSVPAWPGERGRRRGAPGGAEGGAAGYGRAT
jgi:predicted deacylase